MADFGASAVDNEIVPKLWERFVLPPKEVELAPVNKLIRMYYCYVDRPMNDINLVSKTCFLQEKLIHFSIYNVKILNILQSMFL